VRPAWADAQGGKSPVGGGHVGLLAEGKGARGDAGSEGSLRQNRDPRSTNSGGGVMGWASLHNKTKPHIGRRSVL